MRKCLLFLVALIIGIGLGATVVWFKFTIPARRAAAMIYSESVEGNIDTALKLRLGDQENYLKDFDSGLPDFVQAVHYLREDDYTRRALLKAKAYYTATGIPVPSEIATIFSNLPPSDKINGFSLEESKSTLTKIGDVSPVLSLQTIDGQNLDFHGKVATQYIPRSVVIGKDGKIKFQSVGFAPEDFLVLIRTVQTELAK
jgi:hypothetical protein